jgi:ABC-2 type transport system ATP-binding protein
MSIQTASEFAVEVVGVTKRFGKHVAVDNLTLQVPTGRTCGFIGPNGAGKTTTIKMLMGMLRPTAGQTRALGLDVAVDPLTIKQRVGYVPELHFIYRTMRVRDVLGFCRALFGTWNDRLCADLVKLFGIDAARKIKQLSKGTLAKLSLVVALAHEPEVLILDEPMSGLDPLAREEFLDGVLRSVCDRPRTILFSSHMLGDVQRMADMIAFIHEGRLLYCGATDALLSGTKRIRAVLRDGTQPGPPPAGTIWQRVEGREWLLTLRDFTPAAVEQLRAGQPLENVEVLDLGLDDIFKDYIRGQRVPA